MRIFYEIFGKSDDVAEIPDDETTAQVDLDTVPGGAPGDGPPQGDGAEDQLPQLPDQFDDAGAERQKKAPKRVDVEFARSHKYLIKGFDGASQDAVELLGLELDELKDELTSTKRMVAKIEMDLDAGFYDDPEYQRLTARSKFIGDLISRR